MPNFDHKLTRDVDEADPEARRHDFIITIHLDFCDGILVLHAQLLLHLEHGFDFLLLQVQPREGVDVVLVVLRNLQLGSLELCH